MARKKVQMSDEEAMIVEVTKEDRPPARLQYRYKTDRHYAVHITRDVSSWSVHLGLEKLPETVDKQSESHLFEEFVAEPRVFAAELSGKRVGWLETGYQAWNNQVRIWELLVKDEYRGRGVGSKLIETAIKVAKDRRARMLVLETQSCNVPAIVFYKSLGFDLIGFDSASYSNDDVEKGEVRLEFGLRV